MTINANFTGMSNPNQSILFLSNSCGMLLPGPWRKPPASWNLRFSRFSGEFHSSCIQYSHLIRTCQEPGLNIYGGNPPTSREALTRAPGAPQSPRKKPRKTVIFIGEFGSLTLLTGSREPEAPTKTPENGNFSLGSLGVSRPRAPGDLGSYPQVIHRLLTLGEFGSFTQIPPCVSSFLQV